MNIQHKSVFDSLWGFKSVRMCIMDSFKLEIMKTNMQKYNF